MSPTQVRRFRILAKWLNDLLTEVKAEYPDAQYYAHPPATLSLLSGDSHTTESGADRSHPERVIVSARIETLSGGDW